MSRQNESDGLAKRRGFSFADGTTFRTPILLPSFSSKGFPFLQKVFDVLQEHIEDEVLVSAYDVARGLLREDFNFASLVYLDSGGYEASKDRDMSDTHEQTHVTRSWSREEYQTLLREWRTTSPTVFVSYDGPESREPYPKQVELAAGLVPPQGRSLATLLLKPESVDSIRHNVKNLVLACRLMQDFPIIGVTEKEIGNSVLSRMVNIAKLRRALDRLYDDRPIHVFGSLDTITTFLYFLAGADIFDGLTWLRYAFMDHDTIYRHHYGFIQLPFATNSDVAEASTWVSNYRHTRTMLISMKKYLVDGSFVHFGRHHERIKDAYEAMNAELAES